MNKNVWHLKKVKSNDLDLSMAALDSAYAIEQIIKNNNNKKYREDLKRGIALLNLIHKSALNQINTSDIDDELLDKIVLELSKLLSIKVSELNVKTLNIIKALESNHYETHQKDFFINVYNAIENASGKILQ